MKIISSTVFGIILTANFAMAAAVTDLPHACTIKCATYIRDAYINGVGGGKFLDRKNSMFLSSSGSSLPAGAYDSRSPEITVAPDETRVCGVYLNFIVGTDYVERLVPNTDLYSQVITPGKKFSIETHWRNWMNGKAPIWYELPVLELADQLKARAKGKMLELEDLNICK